jgi:hypothetical protein
MDPDHSDAASSARELLPRLRRWDSASWSVPAAPAPVAPARPDPAGPATSEPADPAGPAGSGQARTAGAGVPTRADVAAVVVQRLADVGADAEGEPRRPVPRLADGNLADQLTVMIDDIVRTGDPAALRAAAAELATLRAALGYR